MVNAIAVCKIFRQSGEFGKVARAQQGRPGSLDLFDHFRSAKIRGRYRLRPVACYHICDPVQLRFVGNEAWVDRRGIGDNAQSQAGWPAAIGH